MTSKVLLIASSFEEISLITASLKEKKGRKTTDDSHYPLGLAYLHSYLEARGHDVRTLSENNHEFTVCFKRVVETIDEFSPEIVGFQMLTANRVSSYRLIEYVHEKYPDIQLVIGGIHTTAMYEQLIEKYPFLIAVIGEGEITFSELIEELSNKDKPNLMSIDGIAFNHNNSVVVTNPRKLIDNLDVLPFPKHEVFFTNSRRTSGCIITTRGCPFACSFCALRLITERRVRKRSVKNIIDEIEWMIKKFPQMTTIWIHDDSFFLDNKRVIGFCDEIIRRKINLKFIASGRMKPLSRELVSKLEQANFERILLGLESANERILKAAHKGITQTDAINAFRLFSHSKIRRVCAFLIVGLPGETFETIIETARFVQKLQRIKYVRYYFDATALLSIYPGTEIYEIAKAGHMIDDDYWLSDNPTPLFTLENSLEQLFYFKEVLLNHISMDRLSTAAGLKAQFTMLPYVFKYIKRPGNRSLLLKAILPKRIFELLRKIYRDIKY